MPNRDCPPLAGTHAVASHNGWGVTMMCAGLALLAPDLPFWLPLWRTALHSGYNRRQMHTLWKATFPGLVALMAVKYGLL